MEKSVVCLLKTCNKLKGILKCGKMRLKYFALHYLLTITVQCHCNAAHEITGSRNRFFQAFGGTNFACSLLTFVSVNSTWSMWEVTRLVKS